VEEEEGGEGEEESGRHHEDAELEEGPGAHFEFFAAQGREP